MRFVFWQNMLSIHQSALSRSLQEMDHDVSVVAEQELSHERRVLGWHMPELGAVKVLVAPDGRTINSLARLNPDHSLHLITGTRGWKLGPRAYQACRLARAHIALIQEGADPRGIPGMQRRVLYAFMRATMSHHVDFLLAMGDNGVRWYRRCGWPQRKVFPYAYFMERLSISRGEKRRENGTVFELIYVGQLIHQKGVDLLLRALGELHGLSWALTVVGGGPMEGAYIDLAQRLGVHSRVRFLGALPNLEVMELISASDLLVLPSRFDGWGAVANEALMRGTPVIISSVCGASSLLAEPWRGTTFPSDDLEGLTKQLSNWVERGKTTELLAERIRNWSECITGRAGASYLLRIIDHVYSNAERPLPPWESRGNYDNQITSRATAITSPGLPRVS